MKGPPFETGTGPSDVDRVMSALGTETRRVVLRYFEESVAKTASLEDLTEYVVARQVDSDAREREQVRIRLHHTDLPKLDDAGLLDYDPRTTTVRSRDRDHVYEWVTLLAEG